MIGVLIDGWVPPARRIAQRFRTSFEMSGRLFETARQGTRSLRILTVRARVAMSNVWPDSTAVSKPTSLETIGG